MGNVPLLEQLAAAGKFPHGVDPWGGRHWLTHAIATGNPKSVEWVLSKSVDVHYIDDEGFTALKTALQLESDHQLIHKTDPSNSAAITIQIIDQLVGAGVDVNQRLNLSYTALHAAVAWSSISVIRHLLKLKADPSLCSTDYCSCSSRPVDDAKLLKRWDIHALLSETMGLSPSGRPL